MVESLSRNSCHGAVVVSVNTTFLMRNYSKLNIIKLKLIPLKEALYINNIFLHLGSYYIKHEKQPQKQEQKIFLQFLKNFYFSIFRYPLLATLCTHDDKFQNHMRGTLVETNYWRKIDFNVEIQLQIHPMSQDTKYGLGKKSHFSVYWEVAISND